MGKGLVVVGGHWECPGRLGPRGGWSKGSVGLMPILSTSPCTLGGTLEGFLGEGSHHSPTCLHSASSHC